jgi:hypothetical protein
MAAGMTLEVRSDWYVGPVSSLLFSLYKPRYRCAGRTVFQDLFLPDLFLGIVAVLSFLVKVAAWGQLDKNTRTADEP